MKLLEYESKKILSDRGISIPNGQVIKTPEEINNLPAKVQFPLAVKAQVFTTGRGKAGGIRFAECESELTEIARLMQGDEIRGFPIQSLLVEEKLSIKKELYLGITLDNSRKKRVMLASLLGGMDLNQVAKHDPERIHKRYLHSLIGAPPYLTRELTYQLELPLKLTREVARILKKLYQISLDFDATLAEINPLVVTEDDRLYAADAHIEIEDEAAFRQEKNLAPLAIPIREQKGGKEPTEFERKAAEIDKMSYRGVAGRVVEFEGDLGLLIGAGGASLTTFDAIKRYNGNPANYCEIGGNPPTKKVQELAKLILQKPGVRGIALITNVYSNSRADIVVRGLIKGMLDLGKDPGQFPVLVRTAGAFEEDAYGLLEKYEVRYLDRSTSLDQAAKEAVEMMGEVE